MMKMFASSFSFRADHWVMPPSRPISPVEQLNMLNTIDEEKARQNPEPKKEEIEVKRKKIDNFSFKILSHVFQRYWYYITKGVQSRMIAPQSADQYGRFCSHIASELHPPALQKFHDTLKQEIHDDYDLAIRRAIVDYILLDAR